MKQRNDAIHPTNGVDKLDDCRFKNGPITGKKFRGQNQDNLSAGLNALPQLVNPVAASVLGEYPFVKPDSEPIIAKAAGQILSPVLLGTFMAEEDVVLKVVSGHAFWLAGV
jgi:hypothetical protein